MFHIGRSGSTVVADQLRQHPGLTWAGELLDPRRGSFDRAAALSRIERGLDKAGSRGFGFETKFYHLRRAGLDPAGLLELLAARGFVRFLVIRRRNLLRKIVSSLLARQTGQWHLEAGSGARPILRPMRLDVGAVVVERATTPLLDAMARYQADFTALDRVLGDRPVLRLTFEDDIRPDPARAYRRVTAFLGLPDHPAEVRLVPTTPWPLSRILTNFDEVRAHLAGTPHAWMTDD
ncbi:hypothetical protein STHU_45890 [Allostella humosa]|nr:hypothetical protein STHU_45890 [Stella humosa]